MQIPSWNDHCVLLQLRAIRSKAVQKSLIVLLVIFLTYGRSVFQPLVNVATRSVMVNARTGYNASVYSGENIYAAEDARLGIDKNLGLEMMATTGQYSSAGNSVFEVRPHFSAIAHF